MTDDWHIVRLIKEHRRDAFDCGADELNQYLRRFARQNDSKGLGRTYVAVLPGETVVRGYYSLITSAVACESIPEEARKKLPRASTGLQTEQERRVASSSRRDDDVGWDPLGRATPRSDNEVVAVRRKSPLWRPMQTGRRSRYPVPTALISRLAVDRSMHRRGLGRELLMDGMYRVIQAADSIGIYAVEVDAKDEAARAFYGRYGFASLQDNERHMFLSLAAARRAFGM